MTAPHPELGVALAQRRDECDRRSRWLATTPLLRVYFLSPRPSMPPGPVISTGLATGNGTTDYAWFVWLNGYDGAAEIRWLRRDAGEGAAA